MKENSRKPTNNPHVRKMSKRKIFLLLLGLICGLPIVVIFLIATLVMIYASRLILQSYTHYGVVKGTMMIPRAIYCKWDGPSAKAEDMCMGFFNDDGGSTWEQQKEANRLLNQKLNPELLSETLNLDIKDYVTNVELRFNESGFPGFADAGYFVYTSRT